MNGFRVLALTGLVALGSSAILAAPARAQAPTGATPAQTPRYFYGFGPNGYGYYYYPAVPTAPTNGAGFYSAPAPTAAPAASPAAPRTTRLSSSSRPAADPTGRSVPLYKPWLQPVR